jgi:hypothetical protein
LETRLAKKEHSIIKRDQRQDAHSIARPGLFSSQLRSYHAIIISGNARAPSHHGIFQRRWERGKYCFLVGDEVTSLKFPFYLRASQRLLTSSPTFLTGGLDRHRSPTDFIPPRRIIPMALPHRMGLFLWLWLF